MTCGLLTNLGSIPHVGVIGFFGFRHAEIWGMEKLCIFSKKSPFEMKKLNPFHLAIPVNDLAACREFYGQVLKCPEGRSSDQWVDFDLFGHQLVIHETGSPAAQESNPVDGHAVPIPHFGVVLDWEDWTNLSNHLQSLAIDFIIKPYIRFPGQIGEQATMFFLDPSGNALEFKAFKSMDQLFAK